MLKINDLEAKASKVGKKSESTKKGMDFLFANIKGPLEVEKKILTEKIDSDENMAISHDVGDKIITLTETNNEQEKLKSILKKIEEEQEKLSKKEKELVEREKEILINTKTLIKVITPVVEEKESMLSYKNSTIAAHDLYTLLKKFIDEYTKNHYLVYITILQKTEFGKISKCLIKRNDFLDNRVQRAEVNRSIDDLVKDGFIGYEVGRAQDNDKHPQKFFTLNTPQL